MVQWEHTDRSNNIRIIYLFVLPAARFSALPTLALYEWMRVGR
jgi:hypothetical protein